jgi:hypothetical protein
LWCPEGDVKWKEVKNPTYESPTKFGFVVSVYRNIGSDAEKLELFVSNSGILEER